MARGNRKSLWGEKFGKLVVIENKGTDKYRNSLWLCQCECGEKLIVKGTDLTSGKVISCGICSPKRAKNPKKQKTKQADDELIGQKIGKLTIQKFVWETQKNKYKRKYAICKCDCGKKVKVILGNLKRKQVLSCGCDKKKAIEKTLFVLSDDFVTRFGKLVVDSYDTERKMWKCICDCGNVKYLKKGSLTNNGYRSCGFCNGKRSRNRRTKEELYGDKKEELKND